MHKYFDPLLHILTLNEVCKLNDSILENKTQEIIALILGKVKISFKKPKASNHKFKKWENRQSVYVLFIKRNLKN